ncbi:MAG: adaptor protein MecA [Oscillospiraceae bacterium]|nr:adaptor protein MecA [Oscillospiraceae bacterium]
MTITRINENTLILELLQEEVPNTSNEELVYHILNIVLTAENLDTKNCAFLLEVVESQRGLVFLLTVKGKRKQYKIKSYNEISVFVFDNLEDFISCICALYKTNCNLPQSSTYIMNDRYYLCFSGNPLDRGARVLLSEFGKQERKGKKQLSLLMEHGHILTSRNSINLIGQSFNSKDF